MPGSPPIRIIDPGTIPPPSTKSNSSIPVFHRGSALPVTSRKRIGDATDPPSASVLCPPILRDAPDFPPVAEDLGATSSTSVFQSPHTSHRPAQREYSAP